MNSDGVETGVLEGGGAGSEMQRVSRYIKERVWPVRWSVKKGRNLLTYELELMS